MYLITVDSYILHDPSLNNPSFLVVSPVLHQEDNMADNLTFTVYPSHSSYNHLDRLKSMIEVFEDGVQIFRGRILNDVRGWDNEKRITCEGEFSFLHDSVVRPYSYNGGVEAYLAMLVDSHNSQVDTGKQFVLRDVTVTDSNNYISRASTEYPSTFDELKSKLIGNLGGHVFFSRSGGITYMDYLEDSPYESLQTIEFGKNMLNFKQSNRGDEIATALIPLGAKIDSEEGENAEGARLTIASVNGGMDYITDDDAADEYGLICATQIWDDVTVAANLLTKGTARLAELRQGWNSIEITALDLSLVDKSIDEFRFLEYVQVISSAHNINTKLLVTKLSTDLTNPENSTLTVGMEVKGLSSFISKNEKRVEKIEADYVINEQVKGLVNDISEAVSMIQQQADSILLMVGQEFVRQNDYETQISQLSTTITQTAADIVFNFNALNLAVSNLENDVSNTFQETNKYIRFVDGVIIIGDVASPLTVEIHNDRINFTQNGNAVAYISQSRLYISQAEITTSLKIGNFAFTAEADGGMSIKRS